jgi:hypothetical protein
MVDFRITGPDGEPYPDFADESLRRDLPDLPPSKKQALREAHAIPPHRGALQGVQVNQRGQSIELLPGEGLKNILDLRPLSEDSDVITICFGITGIGFESTPGDITLLPPDIFLRGILEWGVGAANYTAEVDILQGTVISIPASFIRVGARYEPSITATFASLPYRVNASLSYGFIGQRSSPRYTDRFPQVAPGPAGVVSSNIPPFATGFTILSADSTAGGVAVFSPCNFNVRGYQGAGLSSAGSMATGSNLGNQIESQFPLFNSARLLQIENTGPNPADYQVIYSLSL